MRARALIEKNARNDRETIVITEIPYQVNKATLIEKISELVRDKKIEGISDLRDESDRDGIRVVIDLKRDENSSIILNKLYKLTAMESSFGIIMLAIAEGRPQVLNLKQVIEKFIVFRREVVVRRTEFDLARAKERAHILEGLIIALKNIDAIVALIKAAKNPQEASEKLCAKFKLSEIQAKAILEMRLQRLTGLERAKIDEEFKEVKALMARLEAILADPQKVLQVIIDELTEIKERYGDERRSEIVAQQRRYRYRRYDCGRRYDCDNYACRLYQTQSRKPVSQSAPGRPRQGRHGHQGRRFCRKDLCRLHASFPAYLYQYRQGALVESLSDTAGGARGQRQGHSQHD